MMSVPEIKESLQKLADKNTAEVLQRFFKTGAGDYGEGDVFIGIKVPPLRKLSAEFENVRLKTVQALLKSKVHEERTLALMILVRKFAGADEELRKQIYNLYLAHTLFIAAHDALHGPAEEFVRDIVDS